MFEPYEISPNITRPEVRVGRFKDMADAMLRGCAMTRPAVGIQYTERWFGYVRHACALGALAIGLGLPEPARPLVTGRFNELFLVYLQRYGSLIESDNDDGRFTREEIAARIAAL